jgi:hypothetical protein
LTLVNLARNGPGLGVDSAGVLALAAALVLDELPVLLEPPQPAITSTAPMRARIEDLGTGDYSCRSRSREDCSQGSDQRIAASRACPH